MQKKKLYNLLVFIVLLVMVNLAARMFFLRLDFTEDHAYTLNPVTKQVLQSLREPVTVTAYFTKDLPPDLTKTKEDFRSLMAEYTSLAGRNLVFDIIDPADDSALEEKAYKSRIQPYVINIREKDQSIQKMIYLGLVVQYQEHEIALPLLQPGISLEYYITMAIKEMADPSKPRVGIVQGHGELRAADMVQVSGIMASMYNIDYLSLDTIQPLKQQYAALALLGPTKPYSGRDLAVLDRYLASGGNLFAGFQTVGFDYATAEADTIDNGLADWLKAKGVTVEHRFVTDSECGDIGVQQAETGEVVKVPFPFYPIIKRFEEHAITYGMTSLVLQEASPISFNGSAQVTFTPLARTSRQSGTETLPYHIMINRNWTSNDFTQGGLVVAAALEGRLSGNATSRMVVVSNGSFAAGGRSVQLIADNANLLPNAVDWLTDDTGFIALRSKHAVSRNIRQMTDATRTTLKWVNFLLPVAVILVCGAWMLQKQRRRRARRMQPDCYE